MGGWTLSGSSEAQSGVPFTILTGVAPYGGGTTGSARPDYNPSGAITLDPVTHDFRTFTTPLNGTGIFVTHLTPGGAPLSTSQTKFGNLGKNTFRGPDLDVQNFTLIKRIQLKERVALQLRSEFFDLFNHRNFLPPVINMSSPVFGQNTTDPGSTGYGNSGAGGRSILLSGRVIF